MLRGNSMKEVISKQHNNKDFKTLNDYRIVKLPPSGNLLRDRPK